MGKNLTTTYDAIVIGSGIGGLTTAALLSRAANQKVLVLERHYEIGGLSHEFRRGPFSFDVGLHYVGYAIHKSLGKKILHYITDGNIEWNPMDHIHEKFVFPDFSIDVSSSRKEYRSTLLAQFPKERKAIHKYFKDVDKARLWYVKNYLASFLGAGASALMKGLNIASKKTALMTVRAYLDAHFQNPQLKAVLVSRWGDYGLPPSDAAFCIHAVVEDHYMDGGYFPRGGAEQIALQIEKVIEQSGGCILTNCDVSQIVLEQNKAVGVRYRHLTHDSKERVERAATIVSTTGAWSTYNQLLPQTLNLPIQKKLSQFPLKYSAVSLYLGLNDSIEKIGQSGANQWLYDTYDIDSIIDTNAVSPNTPAKALFLSFPSMKNSKALMHTAEVIAFMPFEIFAKWKDQPWKRRDNDYYELKNQITENILAFIEQKIPGFKGLIIFKELATPLTIEHFTGKKMGSLYGLPSTPDRFKIKELGAKTEIENLYLGGGDAAALGIMGALLGGLAAASASMGAMGLFKIVGKAAKSLRTRQAWTNKDTPLNTISKMTATVIEKEPLANQVYRIGFTLPLPTAMSPGQHVKVEVADTEWRAYSLEKIDVHCAWILVDTKHGGPGSRFMEKIQKNDPLLLRLPLTDFTMPSVNQNVVFFATSVGISLIIAVLQELKHRDYKGELTLFFGAPTESAIFIHPIVQEYVNELHLRVKYCTDAPATAPDIFHGTIVDAFEQSGLDATQYEHYLCGNPFMVQAVLQMLQAKGAQKIHW